MNTKLKNLEFESGYDQLFSCKNPKEKIEHLAQMISYRFLSEVEKTCDEMGINKKELAEKVGTSKSYITQLFRGNKHVNTNILARFEEALDITFEIICKLDTESNEQFWAKRFTIEDLKQIRLHTANHTCYFIHKDSHHKQTGKMMEKMAAKNNLNERIYKEVV